MGSKVLKNLFVFEGIDGCGKTTQVKKFVEHLESEFKDYTIQQTAEPTQGPIGKFLRESVLSGKVPLSTKTIIRLFAADREEHLAEIRSHENEKIFTVCDRYIASNIAYQGSTDELNAYARKQNEDFEIPFITFYLRVGEEDVPKIFERVCKRGETKEIFDKIETQKQLARRFDDLFIHDAQTDFSQYLSVIDATKTESEVEESIWKAFRTIMDMR